VAQLIDNNGAFDSRTRLRTRESWVQVLPGAPIFNVLPASSEVVSRPAGPLPEISELIVRMAQDNPGWGYTRIQGALANLKHSVGRGTIANVLKRNGIEPAPERGKRPRWATFLRAHWKCWLPATS